MLYGSLPSFGCIVDGSQWHGKENSLLTDLCYGGVEEYVTLPKTYGCTEMQFLLL